MKFATPARGVILKDGSVVGYDKNGQEFPPGTFSMYEPGWGPNGKLPESPSDSANLSSSSIDSPEEKLPYKGPIEVPQKTTVLSTVRKFFGLPAKKSGKRGVQYYKTSHCSPQAYISTSYGERISKEDIEKIAEKRRRYLNKMDLPKTTAKGSDACTMRRDGPRGSGWYWLRALIPILVGICSVAVMKLWFTAPSHPMISLELTSIGKLKWQESPVEGYKLFTDSEVAYADGGMPLLIILGHVFDVTSGFSSYKPGSGYHGFIGKDGTRAFVTGTFTDEGLISDISDLKLEDYAALAGWLEFYVKTYTFVGYHIGNYYDEEGKETENMKQFKVRLSEAEVSKLSELKMKEAFPPCNVEWTDKKGTTFWCSTKSGGIVRSWEGYVFQFKESPHKDPRCACIQPETFSDPRVSPYPGCKEKTHRCKPIESR